ncbi:hypothetical protein Tco_1316168 [Tanacetum coccineum]
MWRRQKLLWKFLEKGEKRRKHFAALRAQEKRNRPPTKAQKRNQMCVYLKHMGGYKHNQLKGKSYDEIQKLFDKEMKRVNYFLGYEFRSSTKNEEVEEDNEVELKMHLVIVKDDDIAVDAIPLATKPPVIVEYKIIKEGIIGHYQLIRADGSSKRYSSMIRMLQGIDREDLETLWKLVKTKHGDTRPELKIKTMISFSAVMHKISDKLVLSSIMLLLLVEVKMPRVDIMQLESEELKVLEQPEQFLEQLTETDIQEKDEKSSKNGQNQARNGKAWKSQSQIKAKVQERQSQRSKPEPTPKKSLEGPP